jgi:O-acetyl-ADP-ribose deacetylase (regulator of RNase III)
MLKYKVGNLITAALEGEVQIIAHQANCQNTMGSGIAPQIKKALPHAWEADCNVASIKTPLQRLGTCSYGEGEWPHYTLVFNLYGQLHYGRSVQQTDYVALKEAFEDMIFYLSFYNTYEQKIGLPKLGCGEAGGDWKIIEQIIIEELTDKGYNVTIYVLDEKEIPEGRTLVC